MSKKESRRIVPLSAVAIAVFVMLVVFEMLVIGGAIDVRASTVARIAPWAYESFLKFVGEHPESETLKASVRSGQEDDATGAPSGMASVAGFDPGGLIIDLDVQLEEEGDVPLEAVVPVGTPSNAAPSESAMTNSIPDRPKDVVPVG